MDAATLHFLNRFASRSCVFDGAMRFVQGTPMVKGVVLFALVWWALYSAERAPARRNELLAVVMLAPFGAAIARGLSVLLPFRARPVHDRAFAFQPACGFDAPALDGWSSFPSDHAVLYVMVAVGIWFASRRLAALALAYVAAVVLFPRVYLGLHWPTDMVAGAVLGGAFAQVARVPAVRETVGRWGDTLRARAPGPYHGSLFVWTYLLATNFDELRRLGSHTLRVLRHGAL